MREYMRKYRKEKGKEQGKECKGDHAWIKPAAELAPDPDIRILAFIARHIGISNYWNLKKDELITAIKFKLDELS